MALYVSCESHAHSSPHHLSHFEGMKWAAHGQSCVYSDIVMWFGADQYPVAISPACGLPCTLDSHRFARPEKGLGTDLDSLAEGRTLFSALPVPRTK